uniref:Cytochrome P450 CYP736A12-like n=1 Tax=Nelumbo nucifera TaxID=4432 RepID=A0A822YRP5_NELNU|nr:TPA_asm: hypothetical protein HUJ06_005952 [Nelumbo nucifera]
MKKVSKLLDEFLEKIIDEHVQYTNNHQGHHRDFAHVMLSLMEPQDAAKELSNIIGIDRTNIKAIILDMLVGAMDTSATAIEWGFSEILRHTRVMKRVQEELREVVGMDRLVEDLIRLEDLDMVMKESMRLHPVAPLLDPTT